MKKIYDVIILGGGPAGLSAGLYSARAKMSTLIIEKGVPGGQIFSTSEIINYPGASENSTGPSLSERMKQQAEEFGVDFVTDEITKMDITNKTKTLNGNSDTYEGKALIIASGSFPRNIGCKGEEEHVGQGVSYCATCDGGFYTGLEVFAIGGGDAAVEEAIFLTRFARKVTIVHRRDKLRAAKSIVDKAEKNEKIEFMYNTVIEEIKGDGVVESIVFKNTQTGELSEYQVDPNDGVMGVFIFVGYKPNNDLFKDVIKINEAGYIITDERMTTNIDGVFAAGDIRDKPLRQVVTAVSDGAIAAVESEKYVEREFDSE